MPVRRISPLFIWTRALARTYNGRRGGGSHGKRLPRAVANFRRQGNAATFCAILSGCSGTPSADGANGSNARKRYVQSRLDGAPSTAPEALPQGEGKLAPEGDSR
jgi:hypothetical protein